MSKQSPRPFGTLSKLATVAPVSELVGLFRPGIAAPRQSPACIRANTDPPVWSAEDMIILGYEGGLVGVPRGVLIRNLAKHLALMGVPGSGKTVSAFHLLYQLLRKNIPFLVIESGQKTEYRCLKWLRKHIRKIVRRLARKLRIYTAGSGISPLRINPLIYPEGITQDEHIENLLSCFKAAMPMSGPLPALLAEALEEAYDEACRENRQAVMVDVYTAARQVLRRKKYSPQVESDLLAALEVRLGLLTQRAMGRVFSCEEDIPTLEELISGAAVVELAALAPEQACLLTLFLLTRICELVKSMARPENGPRLVILLEEAHNIVGRDTDAAASEANANPKAFAAELICRMLVELRALGVAIVVIDQSPSAVAASVLKNTGTKLAYRQVEREDREVQAASMLMDGVQTDELARLLPGETFLYTEGYFGPRRIVSPNLAAEWEIPNPPVGEVLLEHISDDDWFIEARDARVASELSLASRAMDRFDRERGVITREAKRLVRTHAQRSGRSPESRRVRVLRGRLESSLREIRRTVEPIVTQQLDVAGLPDSLRAWHESCERRFDCAVQASQRCLAVLDRWPNRREAQSL